jgi:hypothetical protein
LKGRPGTLVVGHEYDGRVVRHWVCIMENGHLSTRELPQQTISPSGLTAQSAAVTQLPPPRPGTQQSTLPHLHDLAPSQLTHLAQSPMCGIGASP